MAEVFISAATFELAKLALQFLGALIIARLTVTWALNRFKTEKSWERRTAALADLLSAVREMSRVVDAWIDEEIAGADYAVSHKEDLRQRYRTSRRKLEELTAIGILVLPGTIADALVALEIGLNIKPDSWLDRLEGERVYLHRATAELIKAARGG